MQKKTELCLPLGSSTGLRNGIKKRIVCLYHLKAFTIRIHCFYIEAKYRKGTGRWSHSWMTKYLGMTQIAGDWSSCDWRTFSPQMASSLTCLAPGREWWKDRFRWHCLTEHLPVAYSAWQSQDSCTHRLVQGAKSKSVPRDQGGSCKSS